MRRCRGWWMLLWLAGCPEPELELPEGPAPTPADELGPLTAQFTVALPAFDVGAGVDELQCLSWTLHNEESLYVQGIRSTNEGGFHHGNWYALPEEVFEGEDGYWDCEQRNFEEISAAMTGSVLFAQSTQARVEEQRFEEGVVVKIPPRSKIVANVHFLNASPRPLSTRQWLTFELIHPRQVQTVLSPVLLSYFDLRIPAGARTRHTGRCESSMVQMWPAMELHYVLPHFHGFGVGAELKAIAFEEPYPIFSVEGFDGRALGGTLDPPELIPAGGGLEFSCRYNNWWSEPLQWGLGDGEMCVFLAMADAPAVVAGGVSTGQSIDNVVDGEVQYAGDCEWTTLPLGSAYSSPGERERQSPLYVPPGADADPPELPTCSDVDPTAAAAGPPTLDAVEELVFAPSCTFTSCHGSGASGGLDLRSEGLHDRLLGHAMRRSTQLPLIAPEDPDGSYLLRVLSACELPDGLPPMPSNAPTLLDDEVVAVVRAWIAAGAPGRP